jgi:hypothetical protein
MVETVRNSQKRLKQSETVRNSQKRLKQSETVETAVKAMDRVKKIKRKKLFVFTP